MLPVCIPDVLAPPTFTGSVAAIPVSAKVPTSASIGKLNITSWPVSVKVAAGGMIDIWIS